MLHVVSTPIGNLKDITFRGLETLKEVDEIICEDTRVSRILLKHYAIEKPLVFYNDHNAHSVRPKILKKLSVGKNLALISDAGTPLISDPGYKLLELCMVNNIPIIVEPGVSAVLTALIYSGFPPHPFFFGGFFDKKFLPELQQTKATLIFFESAKRISKVIKYCIEQNIPRSISISREMTKKFEETRRGSLQEVLQSLTEQPIKGEVTFCLSPLLNNTFSRDKIDELIKGYLENKMSLKEAASKVSLITGEKINYLYKRALLIKKK